MTQPVLTRQSGKSCNGQAHARPRPHLLLSLRLRGRHTSHRRLRPLLPPAVHVRLFLFSSAAYPLNISTDRCMANGRPSTLPRASSTSSATKTRTRCPMGSSLRAGTRMSVRVCTIFLWVAVSSGSHGPSEVRCRTSAPLYRVLNAMLQRLWLYLRLRIL